MTILETWNAIKNAKCQNDASRIRANRQAKNQRSKCIIHCHRKPTDVNETLWFIRWRASSKIQHLKRGEFYQKGLHGITNHKISYFVYSNARNHHLFFTTNALCLYLIERYFVSVGLKAISTTCLFGEVNVVNGAWSTVSKCVRSLSIWSYLNEWQFVSNHNGPAQENGLILLLARFYWNIFSRFILHLPRTKGDISAFHMNEGLFVDWFTSFTDCKSSATYS